MTWSGRIYEIQGPEVAQKGNRHSLHSCCYCQILLWKDPTTLSNWYCWLVSPQQVTPVIFSLLFSIESFIGEGMHPESWALLWRTRLWLTFPASQDVFPRLWKIKPEPSVNRDKSLFIIILSGQQPFLWPNQANAFLQKMAGLAK